MQVIGVDHVEIYVGDLDEAIHEFAGRYGFFRLADRASAADRRSVLLVRGTARLVLTTGIGESSEVTAYVREHGDGVRDIALRVADAGAALAAAVAGGAHIRQPPRRDGGIVTAAIDGLETITHTLVQRSDDDPLLPGFATVATPPVTTPPVTTAVDPAAIRAIDHLAICLPRGTLRAAETFCAGVLGLRRTFTERVEFGDQAMDSVVVEDADRRVTFTLVSPDCERGQLIDFLTAYRGGGVQHLAFLTDRIVEAVPRLEAKGIQFLGTPDQYYDALPARLGYSADGARALGRLGVLADRDQWGDLLQIFIRSPFPRRTLFFELIERRNARTFGSANIKALYEAAENARDASLAGTRSA